MHGKDAASVEIVVPVGTLVRQVDSLQDIYLAKQQKLQEEEELKKIALEEEELMKRLETEDVAVNDQLPTEDLTDEELQQLELEQQKLAQEKKEAKKERELEFIRQHFIFRKDYIPHPDRIKLLRSRIPPRIPPQHPICLDLSTDGERHLISRGGRGGFGNPHFTSNEIKGPGIASRGEKGGNIWLEMELKTIADVGLVGLPNAGKSTLLKRITNAHPKIASYPFTTLNPYVGTIEYPDSHTITVADIPGLVAGAHLNVGLGHEFLRHVERSTVLVYVIDLGGLDAGADFRVLVDELERYQAGLTSKPSLVVANKADLGTLARENLDGLREAVREVSVNVGKEVIVVPISARDDKNVGVALAHLRNLVDIVSKNSSQVEPKA
ncbi:UNVERIFIED_CONTAM: Mitochondrial ribosome-associated GTPase 2 [Siphonaria sp. JEL0065]|nr:Mitochondrial ribosome-associated GTPase 2 [Siphonaria sp. JEL0065]